MNILVIDDSALTRQSLKNLLFDLPGVEEVFECTCGAKALSGLVNYQPDIVILDIHLGDSTGFDVLEKFKTSALQPHIIVFTAHPYPQYREKALCLGADYFIDKSTSDELIAVLENLLPKPGKRLVVKSDDCN